jgi:uncharacterized membrane protein YgdD (TMEM256/DUF423 family)
MTKAWIVSGALFGCLGVMLGAFGAHALKESLSERAMQVYQTACHYQFIHAIALILFGIWSQSQAPTGMLAQATGWLFCVGIVLFSGSLYALVLTDIKILGAITPLGGASFIAGWFCFALAAWQSGSSA